MNRIWLLPSHSFFLFWSSQQPYLLICSVCWHGFRIFKHRRFHLTLLQKERWHPSISILGIFLHFLHSVLVGNLSISSLENQELFQHLFEFTHAWTARPLYNCLETRLLLYIGTITDPISWLLPASSRYGQHQLVIWRTSCRTKVNQKGQIF